MTNSQEKKYKAMLFNLGRAETLAYEEDDVRDPKPVAPRTSSQKRTLSKARQIIALNAGISVMRTVPREGVTV